MKQTLIAAVAVAALGGCATIRIPPDRLERSTATMRAAEEVGAADVPDARLHLKFAKEQAEEARRLAEDGDGRALLLQARAQADADLALALAHEARTRRDAMQAVSDLKAVEDSGGTR